MQSSERRRDDGFSFIELLAYMAIAALLILAAIPQFSNYRGQAADLNIKTDLRSIAAYQEASRIDGSGYQRAWTTDAGAQSVSTSSYGPANGMLSCGWQETYAVVALSRSGRAFFITPGEAPQLYKAAFPRSQHQVCPEFERSLGQTGPAHGLWLNDGENAWQTTVRSK